jgi:hypothetical protein
MNLTCALCERSAPLPISRHWMLTWLVKLDEEKNRVVVASWIGVVCNASGLENPEYQSLCVTRIGELAKADGLQLRDQHVDVFCGQAKAWRRLRQLHFNYDWPDEAFDGLTEMLQRLTKAPSNGRDIDVNDLEMR